MDGDGLAGSPDVIRDPKQILVEGKDEFNFFKKMIGKINIRHCEVQDVGGKDQFPAKFPAFIRKPGFSKVTHIAFIRDKNGDNAFASVKNIVEKEGYVAPDAEGQFSNGHPKVGIFIMPGQAIDGTMLEDLCLETIKDKPEMDCVDAFIDCVKQLEVKPKNMSKAKVHAYLASQEKSVGSIGLGAQKGYWDLEAECLDELKGFLEQLR